MIFKVLTSIFAGKFDQLAATSANSFSRLVADEVEYSSAVIHSALKLIFSIAGVIALMAGLIMGFSAALPIAAIAILPEVFPGISKLEVFSISSVVIFLCVILAWRIFSARTEKLMQITDGYLSHWREDDESKFN